jgi:acyl carrier protein
VGAEEEILSKVKRIVSETLGIDEGEIKPETTFVDGLGADSLDIVELIMNFEEEFGIEIPDQDAEGISTVGDVVKYLQSHLS